MPDYSKHTGRSIAVVVGAALLIAIGYFAYLHFASNALPMSGGASQTSNDQPILTPEKKEQLLNGTYGTSAGTAASQSPPAEPAQPAPPPAEVSQHKQVLETNSTQSSGSGSSMSQDEKMKLLQGH